MEPLACSGTCAIAGHPIQLAFQDAIHSVTPSSQPADLYLAPGFIDLQVNGFAGVRYQRPPGPPRPGPPLPPPPPAFPLPPGSIDPRVTALAGVNYTPPRPPHAEIPRSLRGAL